MNEEKKTKLDKIRPFYDHSKDLGNNKISDKRELRYLWSLERMVIIDLSGNDVDSTESYRLFMINKLRHLKV
jgi:hypothetical protein